MFGVAECKACEVPTEDPSGGLCPRCGRHLDSLVREARAQKVPLTTKNVGLFMECVAAAGKKAQARGHGRGAGPGGMWRLNWAEPFFGRRTKLPNGVQ